MMTLKEMQQQYHEYQVQLLAAEKYKKQQQSLNEQIEHVKQDITTYEQQLTEERVKLNKKKQFSFVNAFRTWTGKQQEIIEHQYEHIAAIELKLVEAQLMQEDLQDHLVDIIYKINAINEPYARGQMKELEQQIEQYVVAHNPQMAAKLQEQLHEHALVERLLIEIEEALMAGRDAEIAVMKAAEVLKNAKMYSTWDTFLGGGFIATAMKHDKIDRSKSYIHEAQFALQRFKNELLDIQEMRVGHVQIEADGLVKFADYFFDDIFSEWSVHSKIATAITQLSHVLDDVRNTLNAVEQKKDIALEKKAYIAEQRAKILSNAQQIL